MKANYAVIAGHLRDDELQSLMNEADSALCRHRRKASVYGRIKPAFERTTSIADHGSGSMA
jgi:hypothetical protein